MIVCDNDNIKVKREMTELICGGDEKKFDCVIILVAVFKSPLSRKYEKRIGKGKKHCLCTGNSSKNYRRI